MSLERILDQNENSLTLRKTHKNKGFDVMKYSMDMENFKIKAGWIISPLLSDSIARWQVLNGFLYLYKKYAIEGKGLEIMEEIKGRETTELLPLRLDFESRFGKRRCIFDKGAFVDEGEMRKLLLTGFTMPANFKEMEVLTPFSKYELKNGIRGARELSIASDFNIGHHVNHIASNSANWWMLEKEELKEVKNETIKLFSILPKLTKKN